MRKSDRQQVSLFENVENINLPSPLKCRIAFSVNDRVQREEPEKQKTFYFHKGAIVEARCRSRVLYKS